MKKNIFIVLSILSAAILFTGCAKGGDVNAVGNEKNQSTSSEQNRQETKLLFGKVNAVTGNELEVGLVKDPFADQAPDNGESGDGSMAAAGMTEAASPSDAGGEAQQTPKIKVELTGEEKSISVPAGAKISSQNGGEAQLDSVKKGSVIMILMENDIVKEINILE